MEIPFMHLVTLEHYVDKRNNVYHQLTFFTPPSPLFVEMFNKRLGRLFEALQCDISSQIPKNQRIKKVLKSLVICP